MRYHFCILFSCKIKTNRDWIPPDIWLILLFHADKKIYPKKISHPDGRFLIKAGVKKFKRFERSRKQAKFQFPYSSINFNLSKKKERTRTHAVFLITRKQNQFSSMDSGFPARRAVAFLSVLQCSAIFLSSLFLSLARASQASEAMGEKKFMRRLKPAPRIPSIVIRRRIVEMF